MKLTTDKKVMLISYPTSCLPYAKNTSIPIKKMKSLKDKAKLFLTITILKAKGITCPKG